MSTSGNLPDVGLLPVALIAPKGTRLLFNNSAVPLGWSQDTSTAFNDCSVRTITGTGGGTGGATNWSSWNFGGTFNVNAFTISTAQMPSHTHSVNDPGHTHTMTVANNGGTSPSQINASFTSGSYFTGTMSTDGTGISINANGSGAGIQPNYTTPQVKYTDMIIGVKS